MRFMKKISILISFVLIFSFIFSVSSSASDFSSRTEQFFAKVEEAQALRFVPPFISDVPGMEFYDTYVRVCKDNNGKEYVESAGKSKIAFVEIEMYALKDKLYMYFPQFNCHADLSELYADKTDDVLDDFNGAANAALMIPAHKEHMYFYQSEEKLIEDYGTVYIERYKYDKKAVLHEILENGEIVLPDGVNINKISCDEIAWKLIDMGEKESNVAFFLWAEYAEFVFNEDGNLVGGNYYTGNGADMDHEMFDMNDYKYIAPETDMTKFELPKSSSNSFIFTFFVKLVFSMFVYK